MAVDDTLQQLALELAAAWDPTLDVSEGSSFRTSFLTPLLERAGGSPLDVDTETFLANLLEETYDDVDVSTFSAMRDLVIRAFTVMAQPFRREVEGIKLTQSLNNYESMTRDELNALLGNYFTSLDDGSKAGGTVRMYFPSPQSVVVTPLTQFSTGSALNFYPTQVQSISNVQMSFQQSQSLYYFDVIVEAEEAGSAYEIGTGEVTSVTGISGVTRVTNLARFTGGLDAETKAEGVARVRNSITIRNLITSRGASFVIPENFPAVDTMQVIGYGDDEMDRDIVYGPVAISGIPGGFTGSRNPDLAIGEHIHIGGKTDIYVYQQEPDTDNLDIEDLTDKGRRVYAAATGFTQGGAATSTFEDSTGFFTRRGVVAGDILIIEGGEYTIANVTSDTELDISPSTLDGGLYSQTYEVVRRTAGVVTVPLYDLVAVDNNGDPVFTDAGDPATPTPGSYTNASLLDGSGNLIAKADNVASANISLPLSRITTIEFLDPITLEESGQIIPMRDLLRSESPSAFTGGAVGMLASGTIRLYFRDAVNCYVDRGTTTFTHDGVTFRPVAEVGQTAGGTAGVPDHLTNEITVSGDYTSTVAVGDRFEFLSGSSTNSIFCITGIAYNGGSGKTIFTVRETLADYFTAPEASSQNWEIHIGILEANMTQDATTELYYFDVEVEALLTGTSGNKSANTLFEASGVVTEGWSLKTTDSVTSFSVLELPYLQVTEWVNDTTDIFEAFTAPAIRISYEYTSIVADVQAFADSDTERIVAEDVLIRHFVPSYIRTSMSVRGISTTASKAAIVDFIDSLDPTEDLEVSDIIDTLYTAGATKVLLPETLVALTQSRDRSWSMTYDRDSLVSSRIQHFIADQDYITTTQLT